MSGAYAGNLCSKWGPLVRAAGSRDKHVDILLNEIAALGNICWDFTLLLPDLRAEIDSGPSHGFNIYFFRYTQWFPKRDRPGDLILQRSSVVSFSISSNANNINSSLIILTTLCYKFTDVDQWSPAFPAAIRKCLAVIRFIKYVVVLFLWIELEVWLYVLKLNCTLLHPAVWLSHVSAITC